MGNFLGNLGAAFQGQQDYQTFLAKQEAAKLQMEAQKAQMLEYNAQAEQARQQRARQPQVDQGTLDYLASGGIPKPPPEVQAPAPGQASVPMQQPAKYGSTPIGPAQGGQMGMPPVPQPMMQQPGMPQPGMPPGGQPAPPQGQPAPPPQQPAIPPYQTVGGAPTPPAGPQGIPPPPQQGPAPNSMTIHDAARFIKSQGINDPTTAMQILEKLNPYLNNEAKQEAATLKMQMAHQEKELALHEKAREADVRSQDMRLSVQERNDWHKESNRIHQEMADIARDREGRLKAAGAAGDGSNKLTPGGMAVQEEFARAGKPIPKGKRGEINYALLNSLAEHQKGGAGSGSLVGDMADYKTAASTYSAIQKRSAGIELGVKKLEKDIDLLKSTMDKGNAGFVTVLNQPINYLRTKASDPKLAAYALAAQNVAVEFERLRSGGMLSVAQLHAGAQEDAKKIINGDMSVQETLEKIPVMLQEIENGRQAAKEVEGYYKDQLHGLKPDEKKADAPKLPKEVVAKLKKGENTTFGNGQTWTLDASGNPVQVK